MNTGRTVTVDTAVIITAAKRGAFVGWLLGVGMTVGILWIGGAL